MNKLSRGSLLALFLLLSACNALADACPATPLCNPSNQADRTKCGPLLKGREILPSGQGGEWQGWWYLNRTSTEGSRFWCPFQWQGLDKYAPKTPAEWWGVANTVSSVPGDLTVGIMQALTRFSLTPASGSMDEFEYRLLKYRACKAMWSAPPDPSGWKTGALDNCGNQPTPPILPVLSPYVVTAGTPRPAFAVVSGKRSTSPTGSAVPGQPCDCAALQIIEFNVVRYCASPSITGITGPAVTACTARKQ